MLLKDRRCTSRRSKCLRKPDRENTEAILQYYQDGTTMKDTGSHSDIGWAVRAERIQIANNRILTASSEGGTQLPLNQRPDFAQAIRDCKRLHDEYLAGTQQEYRDIPRRQQIRQRKGQQFEGHEDIDYVVDPNTGWRFYRQSRRNLQTSASGSPANLQAASSSSSTWEQTQ